VRIFAHFWQVLRYECLPNFERLGWKRLADFAFMRLAMPLGWGAKNRWRRTSRFPRLAPLTEDGLLILEQVDRIQLSAIRTLLNQAISSKTKGKFCSVDAFAEDSIRLGRQREILHFSTGDPQCPLAKLARSERFMSVACDFLGLTKEKIVIEAMVDLLLPVRGQDETYDALKFHRDLDAYRFIKIFIYLEDCLKGEGHHEYLSRTHRFFPVRVCAIRGYEPVEILEVIPSSYLIRVSGLAGFAFAENTLGFHRATAPATKPRLMATFIYTESRFRYLYPLHFNSQVQLPAQASQGEMAVSEL
jgi:hypothetical protein